MIKPKTGWFDINLGELWRYRDLIGIFVKRDFVTLYFVVADIFKTTIFDEIGYDTVICLEFLEHVEEDLEVIKKIRNGTRFHGSVPNFSAKAHVRFFNKIEEVELRYAKFFDKFTVDEHLANSSGKKCFLIEVVVRSN